MKRDLTTNQAIQIGVIATVVIIFTIITVALGLYFIIDKKQRTSTVRGSLHESFHHALESCPDDVLTFTKVDGRFNFTCEPAEQK